MHAEGALGMRGPPEAERHGWPLAHVTAHYPHFVTPLGYGQVEQHASSMNRFAEHISQNTGEFT